MAGLVAGVSSGSKAGSLVASLAEVSGGFNLGRNRLFERSQAKTPRLGSNAKALAIRQSEREKLIIWGANI